MPEPTRDKAVFFKANAGPPDETITVECDQAVFTSLRTPMGEGYRVVAASAGVRPEERRVITRVSPSHDSLCDDGSESKEDVQALACYPLPTGRLCIALSQPAGNEHTGRGGLRVYTHNVLLTREQFQCFAFQPFAVARAMSASGLDRPLLKPPATLPKVTLAFRPSLVVPETDPCTGRFDPSWSLQVLERLLDGKHVVVDVDGEWMSAAETFLLGLPGPLREQMSLSGGLRFSVSRAHRLVVLRDDGRAARQIRTDRRCELLRPGTDPAPATPKTRWLGMVGRLLHAGRLDELARRTSQAFADVSAGGLEYVAGLYDDLDELDSADLAALLQMVHRRTAPDDRPPVEGAVENALKDRLLGAMFEAVARRVAGLTGAQLSEVWPELRGLAERRADLRQRLEPAFEAVLETALREDPLGGLAVLFDCFDRNLWSDAATAASWKRRWLDRLIGMSETSDAAAGETLVDALRRWEERFPGDPEAAEWRKKLATASTVGPSP